MGKRRKNPGGIEMKLQLAFVICIFLLSGVMALNDYVDNGGSVQYMNDSGNLTTANAVYYVNFSSNGTGSYIVKANNITLNGLNNSIGEVRAQGYNLSLINISANSFNFNVVRLSVTNLYGEISFLDEINASGNGLNFLLTIGNNSAYINGSFIGSNKSIKVSLFGIGNRFVRPVILNEGIFCSDCYNLTALNAENVIFIANYSGRYSIGENYSASDSVNPGIQFVDPTEGDGTRKTNGIIRINVTANDSNLVSLTINVYDNIGIVSSSTTSSPNNYVYLSDLSGGTYYFNATAADSYGNRNSTETRRVILNGTTITTNTTINANSSNYLKITVYEPKATKYTTNLIKINFTASDPSGISSKWYSNGTMNFSYTNPVTINLQKGDYTFRFYATNSLGITNYSIVQFIVNSISNLSPSSNQSIQVVQSNVSKQPITLSNTKEVMDLNLTGNKGYIIVAGILVLIIAFEAWTLKKRRIENGY